MTEEIEFSRVNAAPYNPRVLLTPEDQDWKDIEASMEEFGLVQPYVWNKRSGNLCGGHQRMNIERHRGKDRGPMVVVDLGPEQEKKLNLALNSVGGRWDPGKLLTVLADLKLAQIDVGTLGLRKLEALKILPVERSQAEARKTLAQRFGLPPFSVLDARQGYWQERKKAWLALGIQSELGRGGHSQRGNRESGENEANSTATAAPGGSPRPACDYRERKRGDGHGRTLV